MGEPVKRQFIFKSTQTQIELLTSIQKHLEDLKENSNMIRAMNTLSHSFATITKIVTTTPVLLYEAVDNRPVMIAHPAVTGEGTDVFYIGNSGVTVATGYPIIIGDFWNFYVLRGADIWGISNGNATAHILIY